MTAAGAYDIATEHAILVEASAAGSLRAVPQAILFGVMLGVLYEMFRILAVIMGLHGAELPAERTGGRYAALVRRLRACRCRPVRGLPPHGEVPEKENVPVRRARHVSAFVLQIVLDVLYFLLCGVFSAVFVYRYSSGILRWYLILGGILGFAAYDRTAGVLIRRLTALITAGLHALLCGVYNLVLYLPLRCGYLLGRACTACLHRMLRRHRARRAERIAARKQRRQQKAAGRTVRTKTTKRIGALWQRKKSSRRKKQVSSQKSRFSSFSDSAPSPCSSCMARSVTTRKKLP